MYLFDTLTFLLITITYVWSSLFLSLESRCNTLFQQVSCPIDFGSCRCEMHDSSFFLIEGILRTVPQKYLSDELSINLL